MSALWTENELTDALGSPPTAPLIGSVDGVSIDSRTLEPGDVFFAIQGDVHDGHDHVARAFEAGAAAAVVARGRAAALAAHRPGLPCRRHPRWRWSGSALRRAREPARASSR